MKCRLCKSSDCSFFISDKKRDYIICNTCKLIFVPDKDFVSKCKEKERYSLHDNAIDDREYMEYLQGFAKELERIPLSDPDILDFGCGREAALTFILQEKGCKCRGYDPLYNRGLDISEKKYDIAILCEVIEHLKDIQKELELVMKILSSKGYSLIRTELYHQKENFHDWWYTKDLTHVNFLSLYTMEKLAVLMGKKIFYTNGKNVVILC